MEQLSLKLDYGALFDQVCDVAQLRSAFDAVRRNGGAPGIDGVTISDFRENLDSNLHALSRSLKEWSYTPQPVKRVRIPKPGSQKKRILGIPCICDRVVQHSLKQSLEPIFEPMFSESSFGFRPGRGQRDAMSQAKEMVNSGLEWVVDIDLATFFDTINHDRLIHLLRKRVSDKRILRLIGMILRGGAMEDGCLVSTEEGSVQGSPLSPLLSNIVLHELDTELECRGLGFCRFADDCNIFVGSEKAAQRVLESLTRFIEGRLKLIVNRVKSQAAHCSQVKFLGMTIIMGRIVISAVSLRRGLDKIRELVPRRTHIPIEEQIATVNRWYRGWAGYYSMTEYPSQLQQIEARIRLRFRLQFIRNQKRRRFLLRKLIKRGIKRRTAYRALYVKHKNDKWWQIAHSFVVGNAWPNRWFKEQGLITISDSSYPHWKDLVAYVKLT
jgi:group II intron reverse transcriptase/maturase